MRDVLQTGSIRNIAEEKASGPKDGATQSAQMNPKRWNTDKNTETVTSFSSNISFQVLKAFFKFNKTKNSES